MVKQEIGLNVQEAVFATMFQAGAVVAVQLKLQGMRCVVEFVNGGHKAGHIITKRGSVKLYRLDTAVAFLRQCGVGLLTVDLIGTNEVKQGRLLK